jgi:predicted permease
MSGRRRSPLHRPADEAVDLEIRHHMDELTERLIAQGATPEAARAHAQARFGNVTRIRHDMLRETRAMERRIHVGEVIGSAVADVHYALRGLRRNPAFAITVIATVALGIGAAAAVFSVLDALLLRPLPYLEPERLVDVNHAFEDGASIPFLFGDQYEAWRDALATQTVARHELVSFVRTDGEEATSVRVLAASHELDDLLGLRAHAGRTFTAEDAVPGLNRAMLTWSYWQRTGARPIASTTIELEGVTFDVVGVLPRDFKFPVASRADLWAVLATDGSVGGRTLVRTGVLTRLAPGATVESLQSMLDARAETLEAASPHRNGWGVALRSVTAWRANPDVVRGVWMLAAAVALMLLVALVNGVNLLLFRSADRAHELAVRMALGGGRVRVLRHILSEGLVIGLAAGLGAVLIAIGAVALIQRVLPQDFSFASVYTFRVQERVVLFTFIISLLAGIVLGLIPGMRIGAHASQFHLLKARTSTRMRSWLSHGLAGLEVALVVALLAGAGLLTNSVLRLLRVDAGFDAGRTIVLELGLPESRYPTPEVRADFYHRLEQRLEATPGIDGVTVANGMPPGTGFSFGVRIQAEGSEPINSAEESLLLPRIGVAPDFLGVIGARLRSGRALTSADIGTDNVLIDHTLARALWGDETPGRRFRTSDDGPWLTVAGVVQHMPMMGLDDRQAPYAIIAPRNPARAAAYMSIGMRTAAGSTPPLGAIRRIVADLDPQLPIRSLAPARSALVESIEKPTFLARIMIAIAVAALLLTAVGIYGVLSYSVTQRRREMGIRMALGARPAGVRRLVMRAGLAVTATGIAIGLAAALAGSRLVASLLFGVHPADPLTFAAVVLVVLGTAAVASYIPAVRATRVDPVEVLRAD